jgi:FkbM family methyltransferase
MKLAPKHLIRRGIKVLMASRKSLRIARFRSPGWYRLRDGVSMYLTPEQYWDQEVIGNGGQWEPALSQVIRSVVKPGDLCLDVGSHKGYVSCVMAQAVGTHGRVLAFDPDPRLGKQFQENVAKNDFSQVRYFDCALSDKEDRIEFNLTNTLGWSTSFPSYLAKPDVVKKIKVQTKTVDQMVSTYGDGRKLSLVKIDAEGAEVLIWRGMEKTLDASSPVIAIEIGFSALEAGGFSLDRFHQELSAKGYTEMFALRAPLLRSRASLVPYDFRKGGRLLVEMILARADSEGLAALRDFKSTQA